jgi:hypothetical protein
MDRLSLVLTLVRIRWTIPLINKKSRRSFIEAVCLVKEDLPNMHTQVWYFLKVD